VYHTNKECHTIDSRVREVSDSELQHHELKLCQWCDPDIEHPNKGVEQDHSYQKLLKEAGENNE
jgi:hypothetical protein